MDDPYRLEEVRRFCNRSTRFIDGRMMKQFWRLGDRAAGSFVMVLGTVRPSKAEECLNVSDGLQLAFGKIELISCSMDRVPIFSIFLLEQILIGSQVQEVRTEVGSALLRLRDVAQQSAAAGP